MAEFPDRTELRAEYAAAVARLNARHRRELLELAGDPPDVAKIPEAFWDRVKKETEDVCAEYLLWLFLRSAIQHGMDEAAARRAGISWAAQEAQEAAQAIVDAIREKIIAAALEAQAAAAEESREAAAAKLADTVDQVFAPDKAALTARVGSSHAMIEGGESAIESLGVAVERFWRHTQNADEGHAGADEDPCPICTPLLDTESELWGDLFPGYAHNNCDCYVEYVEIHSRQLIGEPA